MAKEISKLAIIKKYIDLDPQHPGVVSKDGKKSDPYYLWQSSILGKKKSIRVPKEEVGKVKQFISSAKATARLAEKKTLSLLKSYQAALKSIIKRNRKIRERNHEAEAKAEKAEKKSQSDLSKASK